MLSSSPPEVCGSKNAACSSGSTSGAKRTPPAWVV
jgi:hypothetical protein